MDWIKVETHLPGKSEVVLIADKLGVNENEALGICVRFWCWATNETDDGCLEQCTPRVVDRACQCEEAGQALIDIGWLLVDARGLIIPNWDRHNGESAKKRALAVNRQKRCRSKT